jgi:hypothetical protein
VLSPGAKVDTYELNSGDMYFIPRAYPHHIDNILGDTAHRYLEGYFSEIRRDVETLSDRVHLARLLLHISALARGCVDMKFYLDTMDSRKPHEIKTPLIDTLKDIFQSFVGMLKHYLIESI